MLVCRVRARRWRLSCSVSKCLTQDGLQAPSKARRARWHDFGDEIDVPVHNLLLDDAGRLWVGAEGRLMGYDRTTWQRVEGGDMLVALAQGPAGRIWASGPRGLYVYTPD